MDAMKANSMDITAFSSTATMGVLVQHGVINGTDSFGGVNDTPSAKKEPIGPSHVEAQPLSYISPCLTYLPLEMP